MTHTKIAAIVYIAILVVIVIGYSWHMWCNFRTYRDRIKLINIVSSKENSGEAFKYYDEISYNEHFKALLKAQNPWELYNPLLWFMDAKR